MAFEEIQKGQFGRPALQNTVTVTQWKEQSSLHITISRDVYAKLNEPPFLRILVGKGEHDGFVYFMPVMTKSEGVYKVARQYETSSPKVGITPSRLGLAQRKRPTVRVPFELTDDGLIVDLRKLREPVLLAAE